MYLGDREFFLRYVLHTNENVLRVVLQDPEMHYRAFQIPKDGGVRTIQAIDRNGVLYMLQKALCRNFLDQVPLPVPAVGFVKGESYLSFLKPHVGKRFFLRLDIQSFFDTITAEMICREFAEFFPDRESENLRDFLALCTCGGCLPQGAATSPAVSNVVFRRTDQRILKYCQSFDLLYQDGKRLSEDIRYTRYADDLLFSSDHLDFSRAPFFMGMVSKILQDSGFRLNRGKTRYGSREISLSGFVVSQNIHLSRAKLHPLNQLLHFLGETEVYGTQPYCVRRALLREPNWLAQVNGLRLPDGRGRWKAFRGTEDFLNYLCGYRALLLSVLQANPPEDSGMKQLERKLRKIEMVVDAVLKAD